MGWSLRPGSNGLPAVYKTAALPDELRRHRAAVRCRSGPPALRRRGRSRARRRSFRGWTRTSDGRGQGPAGDDQRPTRNWYGRRDSNSHAAGSEPARYASSRHARMVRRQGLEPRFAGLRVQCCTRIARGARIVWPGGFEPPVSCSQSMRLTARPWPASGPEGTRTLMPSACKTDAHPVELQARG